MTAPTAQTATSMGLLPQQSTEPTADWAQSIAFW